jgi:hypothetical protein
LTGLRAALARDQDLGLVPEGPWLCGGDAEDIHQLAAHLVHPVGRGCGQSVQKHGRCGHILAGPGEGRLLSPLMVDGDGDVPSPSLSVSEVNNYGLLYLEQRLVVV